MKDIADQVAVKQTYWFYGGLTLCPVRIVHLHTRFASQDPEDPPELGCRQFSRMFLYSLPHPGPLGQGAKRRHGDEHTRSYVFSASQTGVRTVMRRLRNFSIKTI